MAERPERRGMHGKWLWVAAFAIALLLGVGYYVFSVQTQPSLVTDEGAELVSPEEVEEEVIDSPQPEDAAPQEQPAEE
jgi:hypothetical protein